ncbi:MAG TPA: FecR family protein [Planctomycetota bacterium]|nr:FecR family protein [Planctomycetota bacterium]
MGDFELAHDIEELLGAAGEPDGNDATLNAAWERQLRVHLLLHARFATGDDDATFASIRAAASGSRRERIADVIGRRTGRRMQRFSWQRLIQPLAAAALILIAIQLGRSLMSAPVATPPTAATPQMVLDHIGQDLVVERGDRRLMPDAGMTLQDGDLLATSASGTSVVFSDGTQVELAAGSRVEFKQQPSKSLKLQAGGLSASVTHQPSDRPLRIDSPGSQVQVVGTRFTLGMELVGTRLTVADGTVRMAGRDGANPLAVTAGQQAVGSWFHAPVLVTPFDPTRLTVRLQVPCDDPTKWNETMYGPITIATHQDAAAAATHLRLSVSSAARDGWGSHGVPVRLADGDRAFALRLRVISAKPGTVIAFDMADDVDNTWRFGEMPLAQGAGWQQVYLPFPPPTDPPARTMKAADGAFLIRRMRLLWVYIRGVAEVDLGSVTVLSDP